MKTYNQVKQSLRLLKHLNNRIQNQLSSPPEPPQQQLSTLAPEEGLTGIAPETQTQKENITQENKGSQKLKPILIFLAVFAVIDIILLIVYFVTSRPFISPISQLLYYIKVYKEKLMNQKKLSVA